MFSRSTSSFQEFSQSCDHMLPYTSYQALCRNILLGYIFSYIYTRSAPKPEANVKWKEKWINLFLLALIDQLAHNYSLKFHPSFLRGNVRETDSCLNASLFLTFPFKKLWGKLNYFSCLFVPALHILHMSCDIMLNISSIIIILMLDIVVMRHYIHKQP